MADKFQLKALITGVDKLSPALDGIRKKVAGFRKQLRSSGMDKIDLVGVAATAAPLVGAMKAAIDFESAMADVKKVVDFDTPEQFKAMNQDIINMSKRLPMAAKEIAAIVASGGQSGIEKSGLTQFAEDAVKMGVAFDLTAEQSGEMMAKWRTAFKMSRDEVVALSDKVNYLGNTGPASAKKISDIVTRIGPLGEVAGVASGEIAALGATISGMGVEEEIAATGIKNFMLALTAGKSATKSQRETFKALRMDASQLAVGMQKDAKGTMTKVLKAISKVDKSKQAAVLSQIFGKESLGAIAPLLTNMKLLESNFAKVADSTKYAGSMTKEYESRAATTANNLQLFQNIVTAVGIAVGNILLPPLNDFLQVTGPIVDSMSDMASANPWLIKGLLGAAGALLAVRLAVMGASIAMGIFNAVTSMSPVGLIVRGIALAAGFLVANWSAVAPFFSVLWDGIKTAFSFAWDFIKSGFLNFSPLGLIVKNWEPIVQFFAGLWDRVKGFVAPLFGGGSVNVSAQGGPGGGVVSPVAAGGLPAQTARANAASGQQQLNGDIKVRFDNAPAGMRVEQPQTNQRGLSITPNVGYRSLTAQ